MITSEKVNYKIISFNKDVGRIEVVYENVIDMIVPIDLFVTPDDLYPTGNDLDALIRASCPIHLLNRKVAIQNGIANEGEIEKLVVKDSIYHNINELFSMLK